MPTRMSKTENQATPPAEDRPARPTRDGSMNRTVYEAIKAGILNNELRPGRKLTHEELAEVLGVSRTPVREALERLNQEGFVLRLPRRGFFVAEIDAEEARELYELREALELYALRRSTAAGLKPAQLRKLDRLNARYDDLLNPDSTRERMVVDRDFHMMLASFAGNHLLQKSLAAAFERLILKIRIDGYRVVRGVEAYREHLELMDALRDGRHDEAEHILATHIQGACRRLLAHMDEQSGSQGVFARLGAP